MIMYRNHCHSIYYLIGNGKDYMNLALKDGTIALTVALGTGKLDTAIDPDNVRFDDNVWHHVLVQRHASDVSIFEGSTDLKLNFCKTIFLFFRLNT